MPIRNDPCDLLKMLCQGAITQSRELLGRIEALADECPAVFADLERRYGAETATLCQKVVDLLRVIEKV